MHMCFGNYKGRSIGGKRPECMFPAFLDLKVDEMHLEMATLNFVPLPLIEQVAKAGIDAAIGIIDVKSYYIETPEDVAQRVRACLKYCAAGAAGVRARLRLESDRSLGGKTEARQHGRGRSPRP